MRNNLLLIFFSIFIISFLTVGGCGGGGDDSDSTQDGSEMVTGDDGTDDPSEEPTEEPTMEETNFISGGEFPDTPQTFSYVENGSSRQSLDYYAISGLPTTKDGLRPAILFIHGGFWLGGSKADVDPFVFEIAEEVGFHLISVGYRLADDMDAPWPGIIQDINTAIRWVKLNSQMLGIDPDSLILAGPSAGGHLAALAATASDISVLQGTENQGVDTTVKASVIIFGVHNLNTVFSFDAIGEIIQLNCDVQSIFGGAGAISLLIDDDCNDEFDTFDPLAGCDQTKLNQASPAVHVDNNDPPMFLAHGTDDCTVLSIQSQEMKDALDSAGVLNEFVLADGGIHNLESLNLTIGTIVDFLESVFDLN